MAHMVSRMAINALPSGELPHTQVLVERSAACAACSASFRKRYELRGAFPSLTRNFIASLMLSPRLAVRASSNPREWNILYESSSSYIISYLDGEKRNMERLCSMVALTAREN